jgi:hypothetical protein
MKETNQKSGGGCLSRFFWVLVILVGLYLLFRMFGIDPVQQVDEQEIIERPHG